MNIPENPSLIYVAIVLFLIGLFLFVSGLNIVRVEKVTVSKGAKTWFVGLILMGMGILIGIPNIERGANKSQELNKISHFCSISILSPKQNEEVITSLMVKGISNNCPKDRIYALILQDTDGDFYKQGEIALAEDGSWSSGVYFGPSWLGQPASLIIASYSGRINWEDVSSILPKTLVVHDHIRINVK